VAHEGLEVVIEERCSHYISDDFRCVVSVTSSLSDTSCRFLLGAMGERSSYSLVNLTSEDYYDYQHLISAIEAVKAETTDVPVSKALVEFIHSDNKVLVPNSEHTGFSNYVVYKSKRRLAYQAIIPISTNRVIDLSIFQSSISSSNALSIRYYLEVGGDYIATNPDSCTSSWELRSTSKNFKRAFSNYAFGVNVSDAEFMKVTTFNIASFYGKRIRYNGNYFDLLDDGTFAGRWNNHPVDGTWKIRDGYMCRTFNNQPTDETCRLWEYKGNSIRETLDRGNGIARMYSVK